MICIVIADAYLITIEGIVARLQDNPAIAIERIALNIDGILSALEEKKIDIVLIAYDLPKCPQVLAMLSAKYPQVKVITMAFKITDDYLSFLQAHEPHGCIMKNDEPEVLHEAMQQVYKFDFYYTPGLERLLHEYQRKKTVGHPVINLTRKEKEILSFDGTGQQQKPDSATA